MAKSKNRRKNGKTVKVNHVERMRANALRDLQDLYICSVVSRDEVESEKFHSIAKTVVYNHKLGDITRVSKLQEVALKKERWHWNIHLGVLCRKQNGDVYIDKEIEVYTHTQVLLSEMNDWVAETLCEQFEQANSLHRLTMFWVATPYDMPTVPLKAVLSPVWKFNVLGQLLTKYEQDTPDHVAIHYVAKTLDNFVDWYLNQGKYQRAMNTQHTLDVTFASTGKRMEKGELKSYKNLLIEMGICEVVGEFDPLALPYAWNGLHLTGECGGLTYSKLMTAFEKVPACIEVDVKVTYDDGVKANVKFRKGETEWL